MKTNTIAEFMSPIKFVVGPQQSLQDARQIMRDNGVRHLPVVNIKGQVCGLLSDRDLKLAMSLPHGRECTVEDAMSPECYIVSEDAKLPDVVANMASKKLGSAVIVNSVGQVAGIFTAVDAFRALASA